MSENGSQNSSGSDSQNDRENTETDVDSALGSDAESNPGENSPGAMQSPVSGDGSALDSPGADSQRGSGSALRPRAGDDESGFSSKSPSWVPATKANIDK